MRINIYNEDIYPDITEVEAIEKPVNNVDFTGIRFIVGERREHTPGDDDSSAVIFWYSDEAVRGWLVAAFTKALELLNDPANRK